MGLFDNDSSEEGIRQNHLTLRKRLKRWAIIAGLIALALLLVFILWLKAVSFTIALLIKGAIGLCTLAFLVLVILLIYYIIKDRM